jgi:two-component system OmpR family sensor kinase
LRVKRFLRRTPLRFKLVALVLVLVIAALMVIGVGSAFALKSYLISQIDGELKANTKTLIMPQNDMVQGSFTLPSDYMVALTNAQGAVLADRSGRPLLAYRASLPANELPSLPSTMEQAQALAGKPYTTTGRIGKVRWRMLVTPLTDDHVVLTVARNLSDVDSASHRLTSIDMLVGVAMLVLVAGLGAALVRTSLKPLVEIEQTAAAIAAGDLSRRVPDPEPGDEEPRTELGRLSRALNMMLAQIEAAFTARAASETASRAAESVARDAAVAAQVSEARARRSEERMRQFIADASHELRTPLTTIRGFAELHRQGAAAAPDETAKLVRRIEDEANRMGLLVEDLLLLARLDRERPLVQSPVELRVIAVDAVQAARAIAPDRAIKLEIAGGSGALVVLGDDARLRQVIGNLMTNAITHTPPDASVTLRLRTEASASIEGAGSLDASRRQPGAPGDVAVIEVVDTGQGLEPEQAERVFERFYRADAARTRRAGGATGTGLGLAIVAALVVAHHGTVEVDSAPGRGATFRVRLPLIPEPDRDHELENDGVSNGASSGSGFGPGFDGN